MTRQPASAAFIGRERYYRESASKVTSHGGRSIFEISFAELSLTSEPASSRAPAGKPASGYAAAILAFGGISVHGRAA